MSALIFSNTHPHARHGFRDVMRWKLRLGPRETSRFPEAVTPALRRDVNRAEWQIMPAQGWRIAWLGHSSFFLAGNGLPLLIDPVFSNYCAPFPLHLPAFRRFQQAACQVADLPSIDAILLTHNHYDHCDLATLKTFPRNTRIICAEGMQQWLLRSM
jgi:N-acyl-phosphatidylethanolamine-hydrolysing phospholipase D